jgi:ADP-ribose pyrophosphatase
VPAAHLESNAYSRREADNIVNDRAEYFDLVNAYPELFRNPPDAGFMILLEEAEIRQAEEGAAERLREAGMPIEWAQVGVAFRDQYVLLLRDAVRFADGSLGTYIRTVAPGHSFPGVVILPVWEGKVLLIRHFRHATRSWHLEIPRGFGLDADPRQSARHELSEEIGVSDARLVDLGEIYPDAGADAGTVALFYAEVTSYGQPELVEGITDIIPTPVAEFERMIRDCELQDGFLLAAYARAKARQLM